MSTGIHDTTSPVRLAPAMLALLTLVACTPEHTAELPHLGATVAETSVSGISSGAYMAGQFQIAHGDVVVGAAIIAGGPYGCAESLFADMLPGPGSALLNATKAINGCMLNAMQIWGVPNPRLLADKARRLADSRRIAPIESVTGDRIYLFSGKEDRTVVPAIVVAAAEFYAALGVPSDRIGLETRLDAGHGFVTEDQGLACDRSTKPYLVDCDYDQAGALLTHIYGALAPRSPAPTGTYHTFDQRPFTRDLGDHGMSDAGVVYVPEGCRTGSGCRIHIAFHGCGQNRALVEEAFVRGTGFDRWADTNRLIVLFPQTATSPFNPQACWDWWGYTGRDYLTRDAPQITAVRRMLDALAAPRASS
ncbi:MAG: poly(3-hydroxybutyrate) depolymerase [Pseudomonadota bacterium]